MGKGRLENDVLALLVYVSKHRFEYQTEQILADAINVNRQRITEILNSEKGIRGESIRKQGGPNSGCLARTASKYGFSYKLYRKRKGLLIDVVYVGRAKHPV